MNNLYTVLEFLIWNGNLPNTTTEMFDVENDGTADAIVSWTSPDTQPTLSQLQTANGSQAFANYMADRLAIQEKAKIERFLDNFDDIEKRYEKAKLEVLIDEVNILRSAAGLSNRTLNQYKQAIKSKL